MRATLAPILTRDDGRMDFAKFTARELWNRWRGFQPWPGAFSFLNGRKLIFTGLLEATPPYPNDLSVGKPGEFISPRTASSWPVRKTRGSRCVRFSLKVSET